MKRILNKDLCKLLQAVGDTFQFPDVVAADYGSMRAVVVLMEFPSPDLWGNHLRRSNFTSCEEILSTEERRAALRCMFDTGSRSWSEFLCTPAKVVVAIRRLEELQRSNAAEVIIPWAWTVGVVGTVDYDGWELIECDTLDLYRTHGIGRLTALSRHITDTTMEIRHTKSLLYYLDPMCRAESVRTPFRLGYGATAGTQGQRRSSHCSSLSVEKVASLVWV